MDDPLALCPFCKQPAVDRLYLRIAEGYDPGCMNCGESRPMGEWADAVLVILPRHPKL